MKIDYFGAKNPDEKPIEEVYSPYNIFLEDGPVEWFESITEEEHEQIEDMRQRAQRGELLTKEDRELIDRIAGKRWLLIKNIYGWKCKICGTTHDYITTGCIERPMNGLNELILVMQEIKQDDENGQETAFSVIRAGAVEYMSEREAKFFLDKITSRYGESFLTRSPIKIVRRGLLARIK